MNALSHFAASEDIGGGNRRATIHAYPRFYRDDASGELVETDCRLRASDRPAVSDWMAKRGVWSLYAHNDGGVAVKHLNHAMTYRLHSLAALGADRSLDVIRLAQHGPPAVGGDSLTWPNVLPGVTRQVVAGPDQFRDVLALSADARTSAVDWMAAHGHDDRSFLVAAYRVDRRNLDGTAGFGMDAEVDGVGISLAEGRETEGRIGLRVAGRLKQYIDAGAATAVDAGEMDDDRHAPKLKRFVEIAGELYLLEGVRLGELARLRPGPVRLNTTTTMQEGVSGYSGCTNGTFDGNNGDDIIGTDKAYMGSGDRYRFVIAFDVSALAGETVSDAYYSLYCFLTFGTGDASIYRVFKPWEESDVTDHQWDKSATKEWATQSCDSGDDGGSENSGDGSGADRLATATAVTAPPNTSAAWHSFGSGDADLVSLVQSWIDGGADDARGVLFTMAGLSRYRFYRGHGYATAGERPILTVVHNGGAAGQPAIKRFGGVPFAASLGRGVW